MDLERVLSGGKNLVRTGWMQRGVPGGVGETISQHSWEAGVLAYYIASKLKENGVYVNAEKAVTIAVFHDIGETLLGDLPKWATEKIGNKKELESEAIRILGIGEELFNEYNSNTVEGRLAKLCDKLSTYLQALRYSKQGYNVKEIVENYKTELERIVNEEPFKIVKDHIYAIVNNLI
ncbi:phosphohydrolase [Sulfolobus acidocaldarius SUSAZ]|nr:phosphohydrolase [Sulfolobus acidocaldarius SUSAZ]